MKFSELMLKAAVKSLIKKPTMYVYYKDLEISLSPVVLMIIFCNFMGLYVRICIFLMYHMFMVLRE